MRTFIGGFVVVGALQVAACLSLPSLASAQQRLISIRHDACRAAVPEPLKGLSTAEVYRSRAPTPDCSTVGKLDLSPGDLVTIRVVNTVASAFKLTVRGVLPIVDTTAPAQGTARPTAPGGKSPTDEPARIAALQAAGLTDIANADDLHRLEARACNRDSLPHLKVEEQRYAVTLGCLSEARDTLVTTFVHDEKYGGYVIQVTPVSATPQPPYLGAITYDLQVRTRKWVITPEAGFTFSSLRDHAYYVAATGTNPPDTAHVLREDQGRRDAASYGVLTLLVVHHTTWWPWFGAAFGVGAMKNGTAAFFLGPAVRAGDVATLAAGIDYGTENATPNGVLLDTTPVQPTVLNQLGSRSRLGFFLAVTFRFLGGTTEAVQRAYAGQQTPTASGAASAPK